MFNLELHESHRHVTYYHSLIIRAEQASEKNDWTNLINFIKKMSEAYGSTNEFKATIDNAVYTPSGLLIRIGRLWSMQEQGM